MSFNTIRLYAGFTVAFLLLLFFNSHTAHGQQFDASTSTYAIQHVHVIDVQQGRVLPDQTVVISGGIIESVESSDTATIDNSMTIIEADGKYILPGFMDMHAHLRGNKLPPWVTTDWLMPLFIANGVTGVREMTSGCDDPKNGPVCLEQMAEWKEEIENGTLLGPRLLSLSSFQLNPPWGYEVTEELAGQMVQSFAGQPLDMIKIYYRLSPRAYRWFVEKAKEQGLVAAGHIPLRMTASEASEAGLRSLEHARDFLFDCFPGTENFRREAMSQNPPVDVMHDMADQYNSEKCRDTFRVMTDNDTWYVPTHVTRRMEAFADDSAFINDPRKQYIPDWVTEAWINDANRVIAIDSTDYGREAFMKFYQKGLEITGEASQAGVRILAGTDSGDSFSYPGFSLHDELQELRSAGMSPAEVIRSATLSGAEFLGVADQFGSVEPGKYADLVLLDENPLVNVANTRAIHAVIFRGEYLDRRNLDSLLQQAKQSARRVLSEN